MQQPACDSVMVEHAYYLGDNSEQNIHKPCGTEIIRVANERSEISISIKPLTTKPLPLNQEKGSFTIIYGSLTHGFLVFSCHFHLVKPCEPVLATPKGPSPASVTRPGRDSSPVRGDADAPRGGVGTCSAEPLRDLD